MKIAVFGGRFDPVHNGHLAVAKEVLKVGAAEEVWMSVEHQHQWRPIIAPAENRIEMVNLAISSLSERSESKGKIKIDTTPLEIGGLTETISVIRRLRQKFSQHEFVFVTGSDQPFNRWTHWDELEKEVHFIIVQRKNSPMENPPANCTLIQDPTYEPLDDSATRIRNFIKEGKSIHGLVPDSVEDYIIEKGLYK